MLKIFPSGLKVLAISLSKLKKERLFLFNYIYLYRPNILLRYKIKDKVIRDNARGIY